MLGTNNASGAVNANIFSRSHDSTWHHHGEIDLTANLRQSISYKKHSIRGDILGRRLDGTLSCLQGDHQLKRKPDCRADLIFSACSIPLRHFHNPHKVSGVLFVFVTLK
jgi:hypothetical protein